MTGSLPGNRLRAAARGAAFLAAACALMLGKTLLFPRRGDAALARLAATGSVADVRRLLREGADANSLDKGGQTALMAAAHRGSADIIRALLIAGADVKARGRDGGTAIHVAARRGHVEAVKTLVAGGADVDEPDDSGWTPLHVAADAGNTAAVRALIAAGADLEVKTRGGKTALLFACRRGRTEVVKALAAAGADLDVQDDRGWTPLRQASDRGHKAAVDVIKAARAAKADARRSRRAARRRAAKPPAGSQPERDWSLEELADTGATTLALLVCLSLAVVLGARALRRPPGDGPTTAPGVPQELAGKYLIGSKVGSGGMGVVYESHDRLLNRKVAVKRMNDSLHEDPHARRRFIQEAEIIAHLTHPNIVNIHDLVVLQESIYLVLEFVDGRSLSAVLAERGRLPLGECAHLMTEVCAAVEFAHEAKILHRDLKPSNIMVDGHGVAKVMDFGLAREAKDSISRVTKQEVIGTMAYMAPEQHLGDAHRATDVFALGVTLYEALTGSLPFKGPDFLAQKERGLYAPARSLIPELPADIDALMADAFHPDHKKRLSSAAALSERLGILAAS